MYMRISPTDSMQSNRKERPPDKNYYDDDCTPMRLPYRFSTAGRIAIDLSAVTMIGHLTWSRARPRDMTSRHAGDLRLQMRRRFDDLRRRRGWKFATKGQGVIGRVPLIVIHDMHCDNNVMCR